MRQKAIIITLALAAIAGGKVQAQEFKRQIEQSTFVPKGQWIAGSSISYSEHTEDNYQFLIIDGSDPTAIHSKSVPWYAMRLKTI